MNVKILKNRTKYKYFNLISFILIELRYIQEYINVVTKVIISNYIIPFIKKNRKYATSLNGNNLLVFITFETKHLSYLEKININLRCTGILG